jgi:hypothetical protein
MPLIQSFRGQYVDRFSDACRLCGDEDYLCFECRHRWGTAAMFCQLRLPGNLSLLARVQVLKCVYKMMEYEAKAR